MMIKALINGTEVEINVGEKIINDLKEMKMKVCEKCPLLKECKEECLIKI